MSLLTEEGHLSVKPCAFVPAILNLPEITTLSLECVGCMLTKSVKYTHQLSQFISALHRGDPQPVEDVIAKLYIVPYDNFTLNDPCNLTYRKSPRGIAPRRSLDFSNSGFVNPEYELVALYPEHFLPSGSVLTIYHDHPQRA
ncbi:hypothetical protein D9615_007445 [Tricholomella constricta]|uniref:Uncharacterized protein n=1 Tax=Tricholomella constricta TaxID=117010 RepID=A0A8H5GYF9_9AGAR|nr:hypothetical protein D9615_007445 [Tricholomella constricta]